MALPRSVVAAALHSLDMDEAGERLGEIGYAVGTKLVVGWVEQGEMRRAGWVLPKTTSEDSSSEG